MNSTNNKKRTKTEEKAVQKQFQELLDICAFIRSDEDRNLIRKAFDIANEAHRNMRRKAGDLYIIHPLCVARIVVEVIGLGTVSVVAALLHDVVEDNPEEFPMEFIEKEFGPKVAAIVDGLTKLPPDSGSESLQQINTFRKMLLTISDDIRVVLIKLADRLHNMRTLDALSPEKQIKIAGETIFLYAPLAHRLGFYSIKQELEDLSLKYRHPQQYKEVLELLKDSELKRNASVEKFMHPIRKKLIERSYQFEMKNCFNSLYFIYDKMHKAGIPFENIHDLSSIRIVFDPDPGIPENIQCWSIYALITEIYLPKHNSIRDWISFPKTNGYESLHFTVMSSDGKWMEMQIRSQRMDEIAEKGYAAHWKYKGLSTHESELDKWMRKIKELLQNPNPDAMEFVDDVKMNLFAHEIHVFTPMGEIKALPQKSTALDFAYEIHSEIGHRAIAARVNNRLLPLNHELQSGDQVEIITTDKNRTQRVWFDEVVTSKARSSIKNNINAENKRLIERGKSIFDEKLENYNVTLDARMMGKILEAYDTTTKEELYGKTGADLITLDDLPKYLMLIGAITVDASKEKNDESKSVARVAKCCNPIPGDDVTGYRHPSGDLILIHKLRCPNAVKLAASRGNLIVPVNWSNVKTLSFQARIALQGIDHCDMYRQIITLITEELKLHVCVFNMASYNDIFEGTIELYVRDTGNLNDLMKRLNDLKGVESVKRLEIFGSE